MEKEAKNYGEAYAFFDCRASKKQIETELPTIRECIKTPSNLELSLTDDVEKLKDTKLMAIAKEAKESGMRYVLQAKYKGATNKQTADEVASVMNQIYQSPLYADKEEFRGAIVYQDRKKYIFRE
jgi:hypothetical protein